MLRNELETKLIKMFNGEHKLKYVLVLMENGKVRGHVISRGPPTKHWTSSHSWSSFFFFLQNNIVL